jgi:hypothetical protein
MESNVFQMAKLVLHRVIVVHIRIKYLVMVVDKMVYVHLIHKQIHVNYLIHVKRLKTMNWHVKRKVKLVCGLKLSIVIQQQLRVYHIIVLKKLLEQNVFPFLILMDLNILFVLYKIMYVLYQMQ